MFKLISRGTEYPYHLHVHMGLELLNDAHRELMVRAKHPSSFDRAVWFVLDAQLLVCYQLDDDNDLVACATG